MVKKYLDLFCDYCGKPLTEEKNKQRNAPSKVKRNKHNLCIFL